MASSASVSPAKKSPNKSAVKKKPITKKKVLIKENYMAYMNKILRRNKDKFVKLMDLKERLRTNNAEYRDLRAQLKAIQRDPKLFASEGESPSEDSDSSD